MVTFNRRKVVNLSGACTPINIGGKYKVKPPLDNVFAIEFNPNNKKYWTKQKIIFHEKDKTWSSIMNIGNGDAKTRFLIIAYVGDNALNLIEYFQKIQKNFSGDIGLERLSDDFQILNEVKIILNKPYNYGFKIYCVLCLKRSQNTFH